MSDLLTRREREIAAMAAAGLTNQEIADNLVVVLGTVKVHMQHILHKLGVSGRGQVAARLVEVGRSESSLAAQSVRLIDEKMRRINGRLQELQALREEYVRSDR